MAHGISGVSNSGYFRLEDDNTQLKTAQRSTFQASASNKLSNWFLSKDNGKLNKIGAGLKALRKADLVTRRAFNGASSGMQRLGVRLGATIDKVKVLDSALGKFDVARNRDRKLAHINERAGLKNMRLDLKIKINAAAPGEMAAAIDTATTKFQQRLREMRYVPLENLSTIAPQRNVPVFMRHANGHRVRTADQRMPFVARKVAQMGSRQYENGVTGLERALKRAGQYGAIGLSSGAQLARQGLYSAAARIAPRESEERSSFLRHAGRARDARRLNSAALKGNQTFADKFDQIQQEQAAERAVLLGDAGYEAVAGQSGVAPAKTRYSARKMDDYFGGADGAGRTKSRKIASAYVALANLEARVSRFYHGRKVKWASRQADTPRMQDIRSYHEAKRNNAQFKIDTSRAALDGQLKDAVRRAGASGADDSVADDSGTDAGGAGEGTPRSDA